MFDSSDSMWLAGSTHDPCWLAAWACVAAAGPSLRNVSCPMGSTQSVVPSDVAAPAVRLCLPLRSRNNHRGCAYVQIEGPLHKQSDHLKDWREVHPSFSRRVCFDF